MGRSWSRPVCSLHWEGLQRDPCLWTKQRTANRRARCLWARCPLQQNRGPGLIGASLQFTPYNCSRKPLMSVHHSAIPAHLLQAWRLLGMLFLLLYGSLMWLHASIHLIQVKKHGLDFAFDDITPSLRGSQSRYRSWSDYIICLRGTSLNISREHTHQHRLVNKDSTYWGRGKEVGMWLAHDR